MVSSPPAAEPAITPILPNLFNNPAINPDTAYAAIIIGSVPVTIPKFGEKYNIEDVPELTDVVHSSQKLENKQLRLDILNQIDALRDEVQNATRSSRVNKYSKEESAKEVNELTDKVEDLKQMIKKILEKE